MKRILERILLACWFAAVAPTAAFGHSMSQAAVLLDFEGEAVSVELQLPVDRLGAVLRIPLTRSTLAQYQAQISEYVRGGVHATLPDGKGFTLQSISGPEFVVVDGAPYVQARLRLTPPPGHRSELFDLHCNVLLDRIPSQVALVSVRSDWRTSTFATEPKLVGVLRGNLRSVTVDRRQGHWMRGFESVFLLGMRHIAEGTDHLLFLLVLLLPAPLLALHHRWSGHVPVGQCFWNIAKVVTAFTLGHSGTLALGALDMVKAPSRPIEVLIAASILVSAIHALRPVFPGREAFIALGFGLVHGLAFATTLAELGLGRWERAAAIFSFNLGIEAMQLLVVAAVIPSLILLSRTGLYSVIRVPGAIFAAVAAAGWIAERLAGLPNPTERLVTELAHRASWMAIALACFAGLAYFFRLKLRPILRANAGILALALLAYSQSQPVSVLELKADLGHVQGIVVSPDSLWVSSVDVPSRKGFLHEVDPLTGTLKRSIEVQDGARFHPGGISKDATSLWVPVAEYRRASTSIIRRLDLRTMQPISQFSVPDHIGCVAVTPTHLVGANWDARQIYVWTHAGELVRKIDNPTDNAFQDLKFNKGKLVGSGLLADKSGAIDWLEYPSLRPSRRWTIGRTDRNVAYTHEGMDLEGDRLWLLPEDAPSRLFQFRLPSR